MPPGARRQARSHRVMRPQEALQQRDESIEGMNVLGQMRDEAMAQRDEVSAPTHGVYAY